MVPVPVAASFDELNAHLAECCLARQAERAGRHADTIGERLVADTQAVRPLPAVPLEPCEKRSARLSSTALVRHRTNDYSVPTAYPVPVGFAMHPVLPEQAQFDRQLGEFILPYDAVQTADDPDAALQAFLQSTYEAAISLAA